MPRAYAKINLGLQILRKRQDGYHEIETVLHPIDIFDTIEFRDEERDIVVESTDPFLPVGESNLCWRAAQAVRRQAKINRGVRIFIDKRIPIGAGLGGGSSDAACVLRELPKFWNINLSDERLREMAASLGSDVPYFLRSGTALARGRGDDLEYFDFSLPYWIVIIYPNIRISTQWAYEQWRPEESSKKLDLKRFLIDHVNEPQIWVDKLRNDFEDIVFRVHEAVRRAKDALYAGGADFAQMSGSGSAVYGLFKVEGDARELAKNIGENLPAFVVEPHSRITF